MNTIPDAWSIHEKFILLPINKWQNEYKRVNIGGISCDHSDYYNSKILIRKYYYLVFQRMMKNLYILVFSYRCLSRFIKWVWRYKALLNPAPKHIIIDRDETGNFVDYVYRNEQSVEEMFQLLGYK